MKYFVNLAVFASAVYFVLGAKLSQYLPGAGMTDVLGLSSGELVFSLATFGSYLLVGLLIFFVPIQMIHSRIREAKRAKLMELNDEYDRLYDQFLEDEDAKELSVRVEELDQIRTRTEGISTWPFQLPSLVKVFLSSLAPVVVYVLKGLSGV